MMIVTMMVKMNDNNHNNKNNDDGHILGGVHATLAIALSIYNASTINLQQKDKNQNNTIIGNNYSFQ